MKNRKLNYGLWSREVGKERTEWEKKGFTYFTRRSSWIEASERERERERERDGGRRVKIEVSWLEIERCVVVRMSVELCRAVLCTNGELLALYYVLWFLKHSERSSRVEKKGRQNRRFFLWLQMKEPEWKNQIMKKMKMKHAMKRSKGIVTTTMND